VCDMPDSCVWHAWFMCVTCLIHVCDMPDSCVWHMWRRLLHHTTTCSFQLCHSIVPFNWTQFQLCHSTISIVWFNNFQCVIQLNEHVMAHVRESCRAHPQSMLLNHHMHTMHHVTHMSELHHSYMGNPYQTYISHIIQYPRARHQITICAQSVMLRALMKYVTHIWESHSAHVWGDHGAHMSHVTQYITKLPYVPVESCHTHEWVMSPIHEEIMAHIWVMAHFWVMAHIQVMAPIQVMAHIWVMAHIRLMSSYTWTQVTQTNCRLHMKSWHSHTYVMSYVWTKHVIIINEGVMAHIWVMSLNVRAHITKPRGIYDSITLPKTICVSHMHAACHTYEWVMACVWMRYVTAINEWVMTHICIMSPNTWAHVTNP